jgi:hypothetical protein
MIYGQQSTNALQADSRFKSFVCSRNSRTEISFKNRGEFMGFFTSVSFVTHVATRGAPLCLARLMQFLFVLAAFAGAGASAQDMGNTLTTNQSLTVNQYLRSTNQQYKLVMQGDGNLALYREPGAYLWGTGATTGRRAVMQGDGNLCMYAAAGGAAWCNFSNGAVGNYFMVLRDSGALEIYRGSPGTVSPAPELAWTTLLDVTYYGNRYEDLRLAFGADAKKLMQHWIAYGRNEGRAPNASINDNAYQANASARFMQQSPRQPLGDVDYLRPGDWITANSGSLVSADRQFQLVVQTDGNVCVYRINPRQGIWCALKNSLDPNYYSLAVLPNGLVCVYNQSALDARTGKIPPGPNNDPKGSPRYCLPDAKGASNRNYFLVLRNDANFTVFRNGDRSQPQEPVWNRAMVQQLNIRDVHPNWFQNLVGAIQNTGSAIGNVFSDGYQIVSNGTQSAVAAVATGTTDAARVVERATVDTANTLARETSNAAVVAANATVNTANKVANDTTAVAVTVGRTVQNGSQVVGKEIVKNGEIVGYAVANLAVDAWSLLKTSCGQIGRKVFPIDPYFQGYKQINGVINTYGGFVPGSAELKRATDLANQCFDWAQDGFYCAFPAEIEKIVSQSASIPGNLINLATRVFNEAKTQECLIAGAATVQFGAMGLQVCALGKVVVTDAQKAFACFSAAESKGVMKKFYTPLAAAGEKANPTTFPNKASCEGIGELAFEVAEKILTNGLSAEAKAAKAAGKSNTVAMVADQLRSVYKIAAAGAKYDDVVRELDALPECK